jgi:organic radical activating enzyme/TusA-related sulfurtransferase
VLAVAVELDARSKTFASGLLVDLIAALARTRPGELLALTSADAAVGRDLEAWARLTGNPIVEAGARSGTNRWVIRNGAAPRDADARPIGSRVWLYTNFDCNLKCDYCCVRSSPSAPRRELGLERVARIAAEAVPLGVREFFVTGGEPFLLPDIGAIIATLSAAAPTVVLTNGMLFRGSRLAALRGLSRDRVTFQISLDSSTPDVHDRHRGAGTWARAREGIALAQAEGFRVRLAATVATEDEEHQFAAALDEWGVAPQNRVLRRVALRGFARDGIALARADLVPEITITAAGVYWHPVGAEDADLMVTAEIFPLASAFDAVRVAFEREQSYADRLARVFHCA